MLFDSSVRPCTATDIKKLQKFADRAYRYKRNNGKLRALIRMQEEKINSFEIRRQRQIDSMRTKIEIIALERLGHILRMLDRTMVKKVALRLWERERTEKGT